MASKRTSSRSRFGASTATVVLRLRTSTWTGKRVYFKFRPLVLTNSHVSWVVVRLDFIGILYTTALAAYLTYAAHLSASDAGFSLNMAGMFPGPCVAEPLGLHVMFQRRSAVLCCNVFAFSTSLRLPVRSCEISSHCQPDEDRNIGNSLERIQQYLAIEHEPEPTPAGVPPAYWPASGSLSVRNLTARYSSVGSKVLHGVSFEVKAGERVGIVGRTGSGKVFAAAHHLHS